MILRSLSRLKLALILCLALAIPTQGLEPETRGETKREQVGTVSGQPVYRDQVRTKGANLRSELHRLFSAPSIREFRESNTEAIAPTAEEIDKTTDFMFRESKKRMAGKYGDSLRKILAEKTKELEKPDLTQKEREKLERYKKSIERSLSPTKRELAFTAEWILKNWKFQRRLYDQFGGGRIVWQQAGTEAFDAMHKFLKQREAAGDFQITDSKLRAEFYDYYTNEKMHGSFLTDDKERIDTSFLTPPWLRESEE